jgi:hypothetical protein
MKLILPSDQITRILKYVKDHNEPDDNACVFVCVDHDALTAAVKDWLDKKIIEYKTTFKTARAVAAKSLVNANKYGWDEATMILNHEEIKDERVNVIILIGYKQDQLDSEAGYIRDFAEGAPYWIEDLEVLTYLVNPDKPLLKTP